MKNAKFLTKEPAEMENKTNLESTTRQFRNILYFPVMDLEILCYCFPAYFFFTTPNLMFLPGSRPVLCRSFHGASTVLRQAYCHSQVISLFKLLRQQLTAISPSLLNEWTLEV